MSPQNSAHEFCKAILEKDSTIRFAGLANKYGKLIGAAYRKGLEPLMNPEETEHYTIQTVLRASTRETFEGKMGKQLFAIAVYEKLIRATIPIIIAESDSDNNKDIQEHKRALKEQNSRLYLLISFELHSEVISIIEDKILPQVRKDKNLLLRLMS
jgi:hypothetical protein